MVKIGDAFNADMSFLEQHAKAFGSIARNLASSGVINATNIIAARNTIAAVGKFVGMDLLFKFKPWGAVKLANAANKVFMVLGIAFEAWDSYNTHRKMEELEESKGQLKSHFEETKEQMIAFINDETQFKQQCFPGVFELEKCIQEFEEGIKKTQERCQGLEKWIQTGEAFKNSEDFIEVEPE